jgi:epsin
MSLRAATRQVKNAVKGYSDLEIKVRQATCNDSFGPSASLMQEITRDISNLYL